MGKNMSQLGLTRKSHDQENHEILEPGIINKLNSQLI
jgi:hypothetical protein